MKRTLQAEHRLLRRLFHTEPLRPEVNARVGGKGKVSARAAFKLVPGEPRSFPKRKGEMCMVLPDIRSRSSAQR